MNLKGRAGTYQVQPSHYKAFIPNPLPPNPPLEMDEEIVKLLSQADQALGRLDGLAQTISDPDLFVYLYVRKEALLSSQIEGTQCSLEDILSENPVVSESKKHDINEVSNYVAAMNEGIKLLDKIPVSTRLIKNIHKVLMQNVRGSNKDPGEYRKTQNWIGSPGANLLKAQFVPPPPNEVGRLMSDLEKYLNDGDDLPFLIRAGLAHAQFETIHPFLDGNGRVGRLLITLLLCSWKVMNKPLLYLSYFFKANRTEYYARLTGVRDKGDWEGWLKFFLRGVAETAEIANTTAIEIKDLHQRDMDHIGIGGYTSSTIKVYQAMCKYPIQSVADLVKTVDAAQPTIQRALDKLVKMKILSELTGQKRNRRYSYPEYLALLTRDTQTRMG